MSDLTPSDLPRLASNARFVPYHEALGRPHIVVDGPAGTGTVLGLSHWPSGAAPATLAADTSTEIASRYVDGDATGPDVDAVTNNHYDEDGVLAAFVLLEHEPAGPVRTLAEEAAHAGDFFTWTRPEAAQVALALMAMAERTTTPFPDVLRALNRAGARDPAGDITVAVLPRVRGLLDDPERYQALWRPGWQRVVADIALLDAGSASITTLPGDDLAIVRAPHRLELLAICPRTDAMRIVHVTDDGLMAVEHRYETWVRYVSRPLPPRVDLAPMLDRLDAVTPNSGCWRFEGIARPRARLTFTDGNGRPAPSGLAADRLVELLQTAGTTRDRATVAQ